MIGPEPCPIEGCTIPWTHHHLLELDGRATACEGISDEYGESLLCCRLGDLYGPKEY